MRRPTERLGILSIRFYSRCVILFAIIGLQETAEITIDRLFSLGMSFNFSLSDSNLKRSVSASFARFSRVSWVRGVDCWSSKVAAFSFGFVISGIFWKTKLIPDEHRDFCFGNTFNLKLFQLVVCRKAWFAAFQRAFSKYRSSGSRKKTMSHWFWDLTRFSCSGAHGHLTPEAPVWNIFSFEKNCSQAWTT